MKYSYSLVAVLLKTAVLAVDVEAERYEVEVGFTPQEEHDDVKRCAVKVDLYDDDHHSDYSDDDYESYADDDYTDYLSGYNAYEPSKNSPIHVAGRKNKKSASFTSPLNVDDLNNRQSLKEERKELGGEEAGKFGVLEHKPKPHETFHDFRDYDPYYYGHDPDEHFEDCVWPKNPLKLDTPEYQYLSAKCKEEVVWQNILMDQTREGFFTGRGLKEVIQQDMALTYDTVTDSMPVNRVKRTHPVGTHTKVEFIPHPKTPYTGIFRGSKHGVMRISETFETTPETPKTTPGHAVKFFRDGMYSANLLAMFALDGQTSFNFFKNRWTSILRENNNLCARATIGKHLASVTDHMGATSVMDMALFDEYGNEEEYPNWPYQVDVEPYDVYGWTDSYQNDMQDQMSVLPPNRALFKVFGFDVAPEFGGKDRLIGWIVSRSYTIDSFWGDTQLFFQHRRMDDDIKVRPHYFDWLQFWDDGTFQETALQNPAPPVMCPFFFLFEDAGLV